MEARSIWPVVMAIPVAAATAWFVARSGSNAAGSAAHDADGALEARVAALEKVQDGSGTAMHVDREMRRSLEELARRQLDAEQSKAAAPAVSGPSATAAENRPSVAAGLATEPASAEHRDAVKRLAAHLVTSAGPPLAEAEFSWAAGQLERETRRGRISPAEAEEIAASLASLPAGHAARPPLAKAVAAGWGHDQRLGPFLGSFAANSEPSLHAGVLAVLDDEHPGPAFSEYVMRLARSERDPAVLAIALDLDHIEAAATSANAAEFVQVLESRVNGGGFDAQMRERFGLAVAVAALRAQEAGSASLRRLADRETETKVAEKFRAAAASILAGEATLKSLERLFE